MLQAQIIRFHTFTNGNESEADQAPADESSHHQLVSPHWFLCWSSIDMSHQSYILHDF